MGDSESVREEKLRDLAPFAVTQKILNATAADSIFYALLTSTSRRGGFRRGNRWKPNRSSGAKPSIAEPLFRRSFST